MISPCVSGRPALRLRIGDARRSVPILGTEAAFSQGRWDPDNLPIWCAAEPGGLMTCGGAGLTAPGSQSRRADEVIKWIAQCPLFAQRWPFG